MVPSGSLPASNPSYMAASSTSAALLNAASASELEAATTGRTTVSSTALYGAAAVLLHAASGTTAVGAAQLLPARAAAGTAGAAGGVPQLLRVRAPAASGLVTHSGPISAPRSAADECFSPPAARRLPGRQLAFASPPGLPRSSGRRGGRTGTSYCPGSPTAGPATSMRDLSSPIRGHCPPGMGSSRGLLRTTETGQQIAAAAAGAAVSAPAAPAAAACAAGGARLEAHDGDNDEFGDLGPTPAERAPVGRIFGSCDRARGGGEGCVPGTPGADVIPSSPALNSRAQRLLVFGSPSACVRSSPRRTAQPVRQPFLRTKQPPTCASSATAPSHRTTGVRPATTILPAATIRSATATGSAIATAASCSAAVQAQGGAGFRGAASAAPAPGGLLSRAPTRRSLSSAVGNALMGGGSSLQLASDDGIVGGAALMGQAHSNASDGGTLPVAASGTAIPHSSGGRCDGIDTVEDEGARPIAYDALAPLLSPTSFKISSTPVRRQRQEVAALLMSPTLVVPGARAAVHRRKFASVAEEFARCQAMASPIAPVKNDGAGGSPDADSPFFSPARMPHTSIDVSVEQDPALQLLPTALLQRLDAAPPSATLQQPPAHTLQPVPPVMSHLLSADYSPIAGRLSPSSALTAAAQFVLPSTTIAALTSVPAQSQSAISSAAQRQGIASQHSTMPAASVENLLQLSDDEHPFHTHARPALSVPPVGGSRPSQHQPTSSVSMTEKQQSARPALQEHVHEQQPPEDSGHQVPVTANNCAHKQPAIQQSTCRKSSNPHQQVPQRAVDLSPNNPPRIASSAATARAKTQSVVLTNAGATAAAVVAVAANGPRRSSRANLCRGGLHDLDDQGLAGDALSDSGDDFLDPKLVRSKVRRRGDDLHDGGSSDGSSGGGSSDDGTDMGEEEGPAQKQNGRRRSTAQTSAPAAVRGGRRKATTVPTSSAAASQCLSPHDRQKAAVQARLQGKMSKTAAACGSAVAGALGSRAGDEAPTRKRRSAAAPRQPRAKRPATTAPTGTGSTAGRKRKPPSAAMPFPPPMLGSGGIGGGGGLPSGYGAARNSASSFNGGGVGPAVARQSSSVQAHLGSHGRAVSAAAAAILAEGGGAPAGSTAAAPTGAAAPASAIGANVSANGAAGSVATASGTIPGGPPPPRPKASKCIRTHAFVRIQKGYQAKHSFSFGTKASAKGTIKASRTRIRRANGQMVRIGHKAPPGAGQGADFLEGFKSESRCFRCGQAGHWVHACPHANGQIHNGKLLPAAAAAAAALLPPPRPTFDLAALVPGLSCEDPALLTDDDLRCVLTTVFGHADFRGEQLSVIKRVLAGEWVLGILPTGAGKSLLYQLPALLLPGVTVVVCPLLALMKDQLDRLPPGLPGAMLGGDQTRADADRVMADVAAGRIKLLYLAPEKLLTPAVLNAIKAGPRLGLVCVDEAHCVAEWGHSFRPAYLRLGHIIKTVLKPTCVLALTATATRPTEHCIAKVLGVQPEGVVRDATVRANLRLQVLHDTGGTTSGRSRARLLALLRGELADVAAVIVYVTLREQANEAADFLSRSGVRASSYHAGKSMPERVRVQEDFVSGALRVVVATTAFGMGVDKACLGAVIHLTMPRSLEDYVQEAGRAGRDGSTARCYLFLDDADFISLRSKASSNACELPSVTSFLHKVFAPVPFLHQQQQRQQWEQQQIHQQEGKQGSTEEQQRQDALDRERQAQFGSSYGVLGLGDMSTELDLQEDSMQTLMSLLQGDDYGLISVLPQTSVCVDVFFHHTPPPQLAPRWPVVAAMLACKTRVFKGAHKMSMARIVQAGNLSSSWALRQLSQLAGCREVHFEVGKAKALSWQVLQPPPPGGVEPLARTLHSRLDALEALSVRRLDVAYAALAAAAAAGSPSSGAQEALLRRHIDAYFEADPSTSTSVGGVGGSLVQAGAADGGGGFEAFMPCMPVDAPEPPVDRPVGTARVIRGFLMEQRARLDERPISAVAIARIMHGLSTAAYPADQWRKCGLWEKFCKTDFRWVLRMARAELQRAAETAADDAATDAATAANKCKKVTRGSTIGTASTQAVAAGASDLGTAAAGGAAGTSDGGRGAPAGGKAKGRKRGRQ